MGYVVLGINKLRSFAKQGVSAKHNAREDYCENADKERSDQNTALIERDVTPREFFLQRLGESGLYNGTSPRKDAVKAFEVIISMNKNELQENPYMDVQDFIETGAKWIKDRFGEKNVYRLDVHNDEETPHLHAIIVPMTPDGRLCYRDVLGQPALMEKAHTELAERMEHLGLKRGLRKSVANAQTMRRFDALQNEAVNDSLPEIGEGETGEEYAARANHSFNVYKAHAVKKQTDLQRERDEALTMIRQYEQSLSGKEINSLREEVQQLRKEKQKDREELDLWNRVKGAIESHKLTDEEEADLLSLLDKAAAANEPTKENEERIDD